MPRRGDSKLKKDFLNSQKYQWYDANLRSGYAGQKMFLAPMSFLWEQQPELKIALKDYRPTQPVMIIRKRRKGVWKERYEILQTKEDWTRKF